MTANPAENHQSKETPDLIPICEKYKVAAAFGGHDHNYQHFLKNGVHYVITGGAGAPRFYLPLDQQLAAPNFAQFVLTAHNVKDREKLAAALSEILRTQYPTIRTRISRLENGPPIGFPVRSSVRVTARPVGRLTKAHKHRSVSADCQRRVCHFPARSSRCGASVA